MSSISLDIIVTTYNRSDKIADLVSMLEQGAPLFENLIVVDSTSEANQELMDNDRVVYLRSSHKNQPYQRFLGYNASSSNWLLYLDDDMEPFDGWGKQLALLVADKGKQYKMFALCFKDKHDQSYLKTTEKSVFSTCNNKLNPIINMIRWLMGYPILPDGKYGANGVKGKLPKKGGEVQYVGGGAFMGHRDVLYKNFNMQLFNLYDKRMGKGEDGILGYTTSKQTKLYYYPEPLFVHNDQGNSIYTRNDYQFNRLVAFSRAYLSLEYFRLNSNPLALARCLFINYSFWRLVGMGLNLVLKPSKMKWDGFRGYLNGTLKGVALKFHKDVNKLKAYWDEEVAKDLMTLDLKSISQAEGKK